MARGTAGSRYLRQSSSERCLLPAMALCHAQRFPGHLESNLKGYRGSLSRCDKAQNCYLPPATLSLNNVRFELIPMFSLSFPKLRSRVMWRSQRVLTWIVLQARQSARPLPFLALSLLSGNLHFENHKVYKAERTGKIQLFKPSLGQNKTKSRGGKSERWVIRAESEAKPELN